MLYFPKTNPILPRPLKEQKGQSIVIFAFAVLGLIAMMGLALDLGLVYIERVRVNRTADAATLAAVVELPYEQDAIERAVEYISLNGYDVGVDTEILVRGCVDPDRSAPFTGAANLSEAALNPITSTTEVVGFPYIASTQQPPRATFLIDTGTYQTGANNAANCNPGGSLYGTATKIQVRGQSFVDMNFMQFFGFGRVPVVDQAVAENITNLDVVIVFDISGSMEYETNCFDCWVRTTYDITNNPYPENGYFNPLPYWSAWAQPGDVWSIPDSNLCTVFPPVPHTEDGFNYLVHEAELYSYNQGDWDMNARLPGQGFWVIQRGSRSGTNAVLEVAGGTNNEANSQGNQAGSLANQSSNVCNPAAGGIDCYLGSGPNADFVCRNDAGADKVVDCSAYIKAHPYPTYSQGTISQAGLQGAAYNAECFTGGALSGQCWSSHPQGPGPSNVPYVEYDFTPTWNGTTYIWIRARGSGDRAYRWASNPPTALNAWDRAVYWQVDTGTVQQNTSAAASLNDWRDNRAQSGEWQWYRLGSANTGTAWNGTTWNQHTLRLYQGSASYRIDKIVFTNDSNTAIPNAMRRDYNGAVDIGPPASNGSATRESCNMCNPAFGREVDPADCSCIKNGGEYGAYGSGARCTNVLTTTQMLENDLYSGVQPIRGAQEAVKRFILRLQPQFDQVGFVAFTDNAYNDSRSRSKLQCLRYESENGTDGARGCYDPTIAGGNPISYTRVLEAVERQWPNGGTDIAEGMREGLEELGITPYALDSDCTTTVNDRHSCDRGGAARRVIILLTDGMPNANPGNCAPGSGRPDLWGLPNIPSGLVGHDDDSFECAMYFAWEASNNNVTVYAIGLGAGAYPDLLTAMATGVDPVGGILDDGNDVTYFNSRGGQYFNAATPEDLDEIFDTILSNIYVRIVG